MYAAKSQGRNRYQFFTPELQQRALRKRNMITDLHEAVHQSQFEVYYQPIISLTGRQHHQGRGAAALASPRVRSSQSRRIHPDRRGNRVDK